MGSPPADVLARPTVIQPARRRSLWRDTRWLLVPAVAFQVVFFFVPMVLVTSESLFDPGLTLRYYVEAFTNPVNTKVLTQTFRMALIVTFLSVAIGYPVAYFMAHTRRLVAALILLAVLVPLWTSLLARTYSWLIMLGRQGFVNTLLLELGIIVEPLPLMYNIIPAVTGMVHALLPFVILPCIAVMRGIDPSLVGAAKSLGATPWQAFRHVYFPLTMPGLMTAIILTFVLALTFFVTPLVLGGTNEFTIVGLIELQIRSTMNWGLGGALSVILLVLTATIVYLYQRRYGLDRLLGGRG